jgi:hypothetical protein
MAAKYTSASPWYNTSIVNNQLGILSIRPVSSEPDDFLYTIESQYTHRPDLLAYDYYKDHKLWWVFIQRNLDVLQDPIFDFIAGTQIYLPKPESLKKVLGT